MALRRWVASWTCACCMACSVSEAPLGDGSEQSNSPASSEDWTEEDEGCVARGTLVATPTGERPVEDLEIGDLVYALDPNTGELIETQVTYRRSNRRRALALVVEGGLRLELTGDHPVYSPAHDSYAHASHWRSGELDTVLVWTGDARERRLVVEVQEVGEREVFDIGVESELHNFIAGGVLVHNKDSADPPDPWEPDLGDDGGSDSGGFVADMAQDECGETCDPFDRFSCPDGQKCTAVACTQGNWDGHYCRDILGDDPVGELCSHDGQTYGDGLDSCEAGAMCIGASIEGSFGQCFPFPSGTAREPICTDGWIYPNFDNALPGVCHRLCDPLAQDCPYDETCLLESSDAFTCYGNPGPTEGAYGDTCEYFNTCDPGLSCVESAWVPEPGCEGETTCCSPFCDLNAPSCPGVGQTCVPYPNPPVEGLENVGICRVP